MYIPIEITATNFQSFESLVYRFPTGKSILVQGENLSDDGQESNGSGKSTLQEIPYYCLIGSSSTGKRDFKLIRRGEQESNITYTLFNSIDKSTLRIERTLYLKKSSTLKIFINDEDQKDKFPTIDEGNRYLLNLIGISSEDIKNFYLIGRERFTPFFKLSESQGRDLISRFSNISFTAKVENIINKEIEENSVILKELADDKTSLHEKVLEFESKIEALEEELENVKENNSPEKVKEAKNKAIEVISNEIIGFETEIQSLKRSQLLIQGNIKEQEKLKTDCENVRNLNSRALQRLSVINYTEKKQKIDQKVLSIETEITKLEQKKTLITKEIAGFNKEISGLEVLLSGSIACPKCEHTFIPGQDVDIEETKTLIEEVRAEVLRLEKEDLEKLIGEISTYQKKKTELLKQINLINTKQKRKDAIVMKCESALRLLKVSVFDNEISTLNRSLQTTLSDINNNENKIVTKKQNIESIKSNTGDNLLVIESIEKSIEKNQTNLSESKISLIEVEKEIEKYEEVEENKRIWILYFKQFYIYLTNQCLKTIQDLCNKFLEQIDTDLRVQVDGFKYLSDGSVKEKITVSILRGSVLEDDYRSFSGGEKAKLIFSTILAFQELINNSCPKGGLDMLFIDEILDSVDGLGMKNFISALNSLHKTIYLTTHISVKDRDENVLLIRKINNKSYIVD